MRYGMKSVIASCLAVTVAAVAFRSSELRDETLWWEEKFVVSKTEHWYVKCPPSADDDATWYHKNRGPDFDCAWVAQKPDTRCSVNGVKEEYVHTWDREAYLRAIATEPRWMEVLDRLCADQI